jgi:hypothetical protein
MATILSLSFSLSTHPHLFLFLCYNVPLLIHWVGPFVNNNMKSLCSQLIWVDSLSGLIPFHQELRDGDREKDGKNINIYIPAYYV